MSHRPIRFLFASAQAVLLGLLLSAGDCQPVDDDDTTPEPGEGNITIVGGGVYETIQEAIDAASDGATIQVTRGIYEENLTINKPLTLAGSGAGLDGVVVTGDGAGTIVSVDLVTGPLLIRGMRFEAPYVELGTARGIRITDSEDVQLNDLYVGFERSDAGACDHGLVGIESSQSNVTLSDSEIFCVGFSSDNGGIGILTQTNAVLTVVDSEISVVGSFGIRANDSSINVSDTTIQQINRPPNAEQFESDGSGIFIEAGSDEVVLDGVTITDGSFVGIWVDQAPAVTVSASTFANFAYGIYYPGGDSAAAGARTLTLTGSTFTDLAQEAVLSISAATVTGSTFQSKILVPNTDVGPLASGLRIISAGGIVDVSGNTFTNLGVRGIGVYGSVNDGNVLEANVIGNTVTDITAGNGIDLQLVDDAVATDNVIVGVDHYYFDDDGGPDAGNINSGFGLDCFNNVSCTLERNDVTDAEFGNYVMLNSSFSSLDDISRGGLGRGWHVQTSQGTLTNPIVEGTFGFGLLGIDSTVAGIGGSITGTRRGPNTVDIDGVDDPLPEELLMYTGGTAAWVTSQGAPTYLSWEGGLFEDNINGGITTFSSQLELVDNVLRNNGFYVDELTDPSPDSAIYVAGYDDLAVTGPLIQGNIIDGGIGFWGIYMSGVPNTRFLDNTVCVGNLAGLYIRDADGSEISGNSIGYSDDPTVTACAEMEWNYGLYLSNFDPTEVADGMLVEDNIIAPPAQQYGLYMSVLGPFELNDNVITGGTTVGAYVTMTLPTGVSTDNDGDMQAEHQGDCDDTDPLVGGLDAVEVAGDGIDNDCDGVTDDGLSTDDADGDGVSIADGDCDDNDPTRSPSLPEVAGNFIDDNCDGWADFDGDMMAPTLTMSGNTISGSGHGLWLYGATADLLPEDGDAAPNTITGVTGTGIYLNSWKYASTPALAPGTATLGEGTVVSETGDRCVQVLGEGASLSATGTTFDQCGANGIEMTAAGSVTLDGTTISNTTGIGLYASNGTILAGGGTTISDSASSGAQLDSLAVASLDGVTITNSISAGLSVNGGTVALGAVDISLSGSSGINLISGSVVGGEGVSVSTSTLGGVVASGGVLELDGSTVATSGVNGIDLSGTLDASLSDLTISDSATFGLFCDGGVADPLVSTVTLDPCTATVTGAVAGDFELTNGCEVDQVCEAPVD